MKNILNSIAGRSRQLLDDPYTGELLFLAGYIIYLARAVWSTTMFPFSGILSKLCLLVSVMLIGTKIILFDRYRTSSFCGLALVVLCAGGVFLSSRYLNALFWLILVMGSKGISLQKILRIYLIITGTIVVLAFCSSLIGVIENLQYTSSDRGVRNSFGIVYVTDFAAFIFYLILVYFYLKGSELKLYHFIGASVLAGLVYHFCNARLDTSCMVLTIVIYGINTFFEHTKYSFCRVRKLWETFWHRIGPFIMPILAALSIITTFSYTPDNSLLTAINKISTNRLSLGKEGLTRFGIALFGQTIDMVGMGGNTATPDDYFFIDCSYVHVLLRYGLVFLLILIGAYILFCFRNKKDLYLLFAIALVAVNCVIAHHIIEAAYNPFAFALLACNAGNANPFPAFATAAPYTSPSPGTAS